MRHQPQLGESPLQLRLLTNDDLAFADSLRAQAEWNQTCEDWRRFLGLEPTGCFLAAWDSVPAGTATTIVYHPDLAWIGMLLVHTDYRGRGIGRALLQHSIHYLHHRGVRCIKLDATPLGKAVYLDCGFEVEWSLTRWVRTAASLPALDLSPTVRPWRDSDTTQLASLDRPAFAPAPTTSRGDPATEPLLVGV